MYKLDMVKNLTREMRPGACYPSIEKEKEKEKR
jgi:hypothetical protein